MLLAKINESAEVTKDVNELTQYINSRIPALIDFGFRVVLALFIFFVGMKVIGVVRKIVKRSLQRSNIDKGVEQFVDSMMKIGLYALLIFSIGKNFGLDTTSVAAVVASGGVAIGLALQGSLSNFAGGVLILLLKPFVVGDYIIEDNNKCEGTVKEIRVFYTKLVTPDNKIIVIPNGTLTNNSLTNATMQKMRRVDLKIDISYNADLRKAKALLEKLLLEEDKFLKEEGIKVFVDTLGPSSVVLGVRGWVKTEDYWEVRWSMLEKMKLTMDEHGIEIPFQQIVVHMENKKN